jgi:hypothetical protein
MNHAPTAEQRRYWTRLAAGGCVITGGPAEIAHCHGGSIVERMQEPKARGVKLRRYHWLVLPLAPELHRTARGSLDEAPEAWEAEYGKQAEWIDLLCHRHGINLWAKAQEGRK